MFDKPFPFLDSDVYKWLEGAGWELGRGARPGDRRDGRRGDRPRRGGPAPGRLPQHVRPGPRPGHRVPRTSSGATSSTAIGHLFQAAIAWHRALGDDRLLLVAERAVASVERALGPGGRDGDRRPSRDRDGPRRAVPGRPASGATSTSPRRSSSGAAAACWQPAGSGAAYWQDHLPVREAPSVGGPRRPPAVPRLRRRRRRRRDRRPRRCSTPSMRRWRDMVATRMYLTGRARQPPQGRGVRRPVRAAARPRLRRDVRGDRARSCSPGGSCSRPATRTAPTSSSGRSTTASCPALSLDGTSFFYVNPLQRRTHRAWAEPERRRARARGTPAPAARRT